MQSTTNLDPVIAFLQAYDGNDAFLKDLKRAHERWGLTDRQYNAARKNMERLAQPQQVVNSAQGLDLTGLPAGTSYHAAHNADGKLNFLRIDNIQDAKSKWNGWVFVKQVIGGNPDERRGSQRPGAAYRGSMQVELATCVAQPNSTMKSYGNELGYCARCNRHLTDAVSRDLGIGPECRKKGL